MPRRASERYHNRVAKKYDAIYDDPFWVLHDELTWNLVRPHIPRDVSAQCCDLGCGTGKWGLKLLKSGFATTFVDHAPNMIDQTRQHVQALGPKARHATLLVGDIVDMPELPAGRFTLTLAMGDPLSICQDPAAATREMFRCCAPGGIVIATADNKLAALEHYVEKGDLDALAAFAHTGRTNWLTSDAREQFELTTFTPAGLRKLFESAGFEVLSLAGKTILPLRTNRKLLEKPNAIATLLRVEQELAKDPSAVARAGHLQIVVQKPG